MSKKSFWSSLWEIFSAYLAGQETTKKKGSASSPPSVSSPVPAPPPAGLWPSYSAPDYCQHGRAGENEYREAAHRSAKAAGLDCIRFSLTTVPNPELSMHLFYYKSPVDGHILGDWYNKAKAMGITRWQVDLTRCSDLVAAKDRFKDYPAGTVQYIEK